MSTERQNYRTPCADIPEHRLLICRMLVQLGCRVATVEHPGYIRVVTTDGDVLHLGTANGPWQADVFAAQERCAHCGHVRPSGSTEYGACDSRCAWMAPDSHLQPAYTITVSGAHVRTAEGVARFVVGRLLHDYGLLAYASADEQRRADRAERSARNGRG